MGRPIVPRDWRQARDTPPFLPRASPALRRLPRCLRTAGAIGDRGLS